jgi:hyaluronan synthase
MFDADSGIYALIGILVVVVGSALIKIRFHKDKSITNYRHKKLEKDGPLQASFHNGRSVFLLLALVAALAWTTWQVWSISMGYAPELKIFYIIFGSLFIAQLLLASTARPFREKTVLDVNHRFKTAIIVPVYNESEGSLRDGLESFFYQTVLPDEIHIVDDGSKHTYARTKKWFLATAEKAGIVASWTRQVNTGKRHAHVKAIDNLKNRENTIIITIDSDGVLDTHAIEEGLKPFHDPAVKSVAGIIIARNAQQNLLARITDLIFVSAQQLIDRAAMSQLGNVLVNSGGLAFYRWGVVKQAIDHGYTEELFFGRSIRFSDDSYLTLFALLGGKAVQQPSSIVFADMPVKFSHHYRQQLRWSRGSFIRSWWRLRHLTVSSPAYLRQIMGWTVFLSMTVVLIQLLIVIPLTRHIYPPVELLLIPLIFGYLQGSRYFTIRRSDMSLKSQSLTFLMAPLAVLWSAVVLRLIRWYAIMTCFETGWGTRQNIEITRNSDAAVPLK